MNKTSEQPSATPILDLQQPLPMPDTERMNGRFAFPFLTFVTLIVLTANISFLVVPFCFLLINFITIVIHEGGHLIAGWCVGLHFKGVRVDPFRIRVDSGRWKFKVRPRLFWGFAFMSLDRVRRVRSRLIIFVFGGPIASLLFGVGLAIGGEIALIQHYESPWPAFCEFLGVWSFVIGCLGLIPFISRGYANDGMILRALLFRRDEALPMIASYALSAIKDRDPFVPDYFMRWFQVASTRTILQTSNYGANWLGYMGAHEEAVAAQFLERCLADSAAMDDDERDKLIAEAAVFTAWRRNDTSKAETWFKRIQLLDRLHPLSRARVRIALLCAHEEFDAAISELNRGLVLMRDQPVTAQRQKCEAEWIAWSEQIQQRSLVTVVT